MQNDRNTTAGFVPARKSPNNSTTVLYQHPDGFELSFKDGELIASDPDNNTVSVPIGPAGLIRVGLLMAALGGAD
ncbi:MAG: hypothetical protein U1C60_09385 [Rhodocyclaceae bacterium]|nr:hypothetical protein [Rhodocyclaceae bacterium]